MFQPKYLNCRNCGNVLEELWDWDWCKVCFKIHCDETYGSPFQQNFTIMWNAMESAMKKGKIPATRGIKDAQEKEIKRLAEIEKNKPTKEEQEFIDIVSKVINDNKEDWQLFKKLRRKSGMFVGMVMKKDRNLSPSMVSDIVQEKLGLKLTKQEIKGMAIEYGVSEEFVVSVSEYLDNELK